MTTTDTLLRATLLAWCIIGWAKIAGVIIDGVRNLGRK